MSKNMSKSYGNTFLYYKGEYEKEIFKFLVNSHRVDRSENSFDDIRYEVKKQQVTHTLSKILDSKNVILMINESEPMPRAFRVFVGKDPKDNKTVKAFIDVTDIITEENGYYGYNRRNIPILISYLISAMNGLIYSVAPARILGNSDIVKYGTNAFAGLFSYIIDYLRIGGVHDARQISLYLSALYFQVNLLGNDITDTIEYKAKSISDLTNPQIAKIKFNLNNYKDPFKNIETFINTLSDILHVQDVLSLDVFINKWILLFGSGTQFATELYPAFSDMLIHTYTAVNLNRQTTIEKITGINMVEFVKAIFKVGGDSI